MKGLLTDHRLTVPDRRYKNRFELTLIFKILPRVSYHVWDYFIGTKDECEEVVRKFRENPPVIWFTAEVYVEDKKVKRYVKIFPAGKRRPKGFWFENPKAALDGASAKEIVRLDKELRRLKQFRRSIK